MCRGCGHRRIQCMRPSADTGSRPTWPCFHEAIVRARDRSHAHRATTHASTPPAAARPSFGGQCTGTAPGPAATRGRPALAASMLRALQALGKSACGRAAKPSTRASSPATLGTDRPHKRDGKPAMGSLERPPASHISARSHSRLLTGVWHQQVSWWRSGRGFSIIFWLDRRTGTLRCDLCEAHTVGLAPSPKAQRPEQKIGHSAKT